VRLAEYRAGALLLLNPWCRRERRHTIDLSSQESSKGRPRTGITWYSREHEIMAALQHNAYSTENAELVSTYAIELEECGRINKKGIQ
jgi:hypothetical protein